MKIKYLITCVLFIALVGACGGKEATSFETASGISLPAAAEQVESFDDGKFVKTIVYKSDSQSVKNFIAANKFEPFTQANIPQFWGVNYLKEKLDAGNQAGVYYKTGYGGNSSWICIAEIRSARIFTELKYPGKTAY